VVIPSGDGTRNLNLERLVASLPHQSLPPDEIEVVRGVRPNGHARNTGVAKSCGEILVFLDDDVQLGTPDVLRTFVEHLAADPRLGLVGTSQVIPPESTPFQRRCAAQLSRSQSPVVEVLTDSDMVTTQCCAMRRAVLDEVGGFHGKILRGVDPELRERVRRAGYRIAVVPQAWHYHPMPASLRALLNMAWRDGGASAYARKHFPEAVIFNPEGHVAEFDARPSFARRILRNVGRLGTDLLSGRWYSALYGLVYMAGNLLGGR
jgi:glycosyltransferase involved in cell wall biosynthesis